jgi:membrane-associated PAP2 superfamily phosphatase
MLAITQREPAPGSESPSRWGPLVPTLTALALIALWEASGLDLPTEHLFGDGNGFALRDHWLFSAALHEWGRRVSWMLAMALSIGVWWPWGVLRRLTLSQRLQLAMTGLIAAGAVAMLKSTSATSCPWDLREFGGLASYVSHWNWWTEDGGSGRCFPAGHASSGFAFVGGWFAFRDHPRIARRWLSASLVAGFLFGIAQQVRGAHFMSHTLWTAWLCWITAWAIDVVWPTIKAKVHA